MTSQNTNTAISLADLDETTKAALLKEEKALRGQEKEAKQHQIKLDRLVAYRDGAVCEANPKGISNPALLPETLCRAPEAVVGGSVSHGWTVEIACLDCTARRTINLQDAFQSKRCSGCKVESRKAISKTKRAEKSGTSLDPASTLERITKLEAAGVELSPQTAKLKALCLQLTGAEAEEEATVEAAPAPTPRRTRRSRSNKS